MFSSQAVSASIVDTEHDTPVDIADALTVVADEPTKTRADAAKGQRVRGTHRPTLETADGVRSVGFTNQAWGATDTERMQRLHSVTSRRTPPAGGPVAVLANVPEISSRLHRRTALLAADLTPVIGRTFAVLNALDEYRTLTPTARHEVFESVQLSARIWFEVLLSGKSLPEHEISALQQFGRMRVHQRVPLSCVLNAVRIGLREIWRAYVALGEEDATLTEELLVKISPFLFEYFDLLAQITVQTYLTEQYEQASWREPLLHQLYSIVFHSPGDVEGFRATADALGMDFAAPRIALAMDIDVAVLGLASRNDALDRIVVAAARHLHAAPDNLVRAWHRQRLIIWVPCPPGDSVSRCDQKMTTYATSLAYAVPEIRRIGIGLMNDGPSGWAASVEEAIRALDFGSGDGTDRRVCAWSSFVIEEGVRRADNVRRYLLSLVEQLSNEPGLLTTLEVYFAKGQRRSTAANALNIHPNTLNYRIERIETILGASLTDVSWIAKLSVALRLRHAVSANH